MGRSIQNLKNKTFTAEEPARKSVYIFTALAGFLCLALSVQFMGLDDLKTRGNAITKQRSNPKLTTVDRKLWWKKKARKIRERKEINVLMGQVEVIHPVTPKNQAPDLQGTRTGTQVNLETIPTLLFSETKPRKIQ